MLLYLAWYFYVMLSNTVNESKHFKKDFSDIQKNKAWIYGLILFIAAYEKTLLS